jgi:thiol-disulfide isomerase/thioredoxin
MSIRPLVAAVLLSFCLPTNAKAQALAIKINGQLKPDDPLGAVIKAPTKMHYFKMAKGKTYIIRPGEAQFKVLLMVEDSDKVRMTDFKTYLRETLTGDSSLLFTAPKDDTFGIVVTTADDKLGQYELIIEPASEKLHELARLKSPLDETVMSRHAKVNQARTESDVAKVWRQIHEVAADFVVQAIAFAKANPDDPASKDALKYALVNLWLLIDWNAFTDASPLAARRLGVVIDQAESKDIRAIAMYVLAGNLASQALSAATKKDIKQAASLNGQATELLDRVVKEDTDIRLQGSQATLTQVAKDLLFVLTNLSVGCKALDMVGEDIVGKSFKLSDYRGKVTVVYFWGSWCGPCKAMIPHEKELASKFAKAPFALVGINTDNVKNKAKEFLQKEGIAWTQVWDGGSTRGPLVRAWKVDAFPTIYVLDANGVICLQAFGDPGVVLDELIEELLTGLKK